MDEGAYVQDVWRVIMANHRTPKTTWGDFHAMMASLSTAEHRLQRLVAQLGLDRFDEICTELVAYADRWMRGEISRIPNGVYSFVDSMEDDGVTNEPSYIRASVVVEDDEILVDLSESDPQAQGPINCTYVATCAASYAGVLQAIGAQDVPLNSGCFRPLTVLAPPGTVVNVSFPGPCVGGNTETQPRIIGTVLGALAQAVPDDVGAGEGGTCCNVLLGGWHPRSGDFYTHYQFEGGGWGGRPKQDGNDAQCTAHASIVRATPVEVFETRFPLRHVSFSLRTDSGGPGRHRGGLGVCRVLEIVADEVVVSALCDRMKQGPWGLAGGLDGATGGVFVRPFGELEFRTFTDVFGCTSLSKFVNIVLRRGDQIMVASPGGGGFGAPDERPYDDVVRDVLDRYISQSAASERYGCEVGLAELDWAIAPSAPGAPSKLPVLA